jgi:hypothetical protein
MFSPQDTTTSTEPLNRRTPEAEAEAQPSQALGFPAWRKILLSPPGKALCIITVHLGLGETSRYVRARLACSVDTCLATVSTRSCRRYGRWHANVDTRSRTDVRLPAYAVHASPRSAARCQSAAHPQLCSCAHLHRYQALLAPTGSTPRWSCSAGRSRCSTLMRVCRVSAVDVSALRKRRHLFWQSVLLCGRQLHNGRVRHLIQSVPVPCTIPAVQCTHCP